jgi:hypothetical protein
MMAKLGWPDVECGGVVVDVAEDLAVGGLIVAKREEAGPAMKRLIREPHFLLGLLWG